MPAALGAALQACEASPRTTHAQARALVAAFVDAYYDDMLARLDDAALGDLERRCSRALHEQGEPEKEEFEFHFANELIRRNQLGHAMARLRARESTANRTELVYQRVRRLVLLAELECLGRDYQAALDLLGHAIAYHDDLTKPRRDGDDALRGALSQALITAHCARAITLSDLDRRGEAIEDLTRARAMAERSGDTQTIAYVLKRETDVDLARGAFADVVKKITDHEHEHGVSSPELRLTRGIAQWRLAQSQPESLTTALAELRALANDERAPHYRLPAVVRLLEASIQARDWSMARHWREQGVSLVGLAADPDGEAISVIALSARLARESDAELAELRDSTRRLGACIEQLAARWGRLDIGTDGGGYAHTTPERHAIGELISSILALAQREGRGGGREAIDMLLRVSACTSLSRVHGCSPGTLADLQSTLVAADRGLLLFWPGRTDSHLFAVDAAGVAHCDLPSESALRTLAAAMRERMVDLANVTEGRRQRVGLDAMRRADELRQALLPEAAWQRVQTWQAVAVFGMDFLQGIPPEALTLADGSLLGERMAVSTLPSLPWAAVAHRHSVRNRPATDLSLLACLSSPGNAGKTTLTSFPEHAKKSWQRVAAERRSTVFDTDATVDRLLGLPRARVVHLLGHGVANPLGRGQGLALHDANAWHDQFASARFAPSALCILSVCKGGAGVVRRGEWSSGTLGGALLRAGAAAVIQSNEDLFLGEHLELLELFYSRLLEGAHSGTALQHARAELARRSDAVARLLRAKLQLVGIDHAPFARH